MFLEVKHLKKGFGSGENRVEVLKDISFSLKKGVNHFFCVLDGYWLRTPPLTEPVRNAAA